VLICICCVTDVHPVRANVVDFTALKLLGDVKGKSVLDIGCGSGRLVRKLTDKGANVTGVDISEEQIKLAVKEEENRHFPNKAQYVVEDIRTPASKLGGEFDFVVQIYLLNYAADYAELLTMAKYIYSRLKKGGVFIGVSSKMDLDMKNADKLWKYGYHNIRNEGLHDGDIIEFHYKPPFGDGKGEIKLTAHYLSPATYAKAFKEAGFVGEGELKWVPLSLDLHTSDTHYYEDYMKYPDAAAFIAKKI